MTKLFENIVRKRVKETLEAEWISMVDDLIQRNAAYKGGEAAKPVAELVAQKTAVNTAQREASIIANRKMEELASNLMTNLRSWLPGEVQKQFTNQIQEMYQLNPANQYLIVVKDERTAEDLVKACADHLDLEHGPRIVFVVADRINVVEIVK